MRKSGGYVGYAYTLADARGVMALQQHHRHRIADDCKEYCSVTANVMGIKFYHGVVRMCIWREKRTISSIIILFGFY